VSLAFSSGKLARTTGGGSWAVQTMLHCVSVEPGHACPNIYRGLDRYWHLSDAISLIVHEDLKLLPLYQENLDRVWEHYDDLRAAAWVAPQINPIPSGTEFTREMPRFFALMDWDPVPAYIARDYELIATVEAPGGVDQDEALAHVRDMMAGNELLQDWPLEFLGFDIIEWPSNWSVPGNLSHWSRDRWTKESLCLNDCWLSPDWQTVDRLWRIYMSAGDPDFSLKDAYMYHPVGVIGLGAIDRVTGRLRAP
jgi:hypothetical protein